MKEGNGKPLSRKEAAAHKKVVAQQEEFLRKYGWYAHYVYDDPTLPTHVNIHTHGLSQSWNHADIQIVLNLEPQQAHEVLRSVVGLIKEGVRFEPGKEYDNVLGEGLRVRFAWTHEGKRWVLRMILPDSDGRLLPGEMQPKFAEQWVGIEGVEGAESEEAP